MSMLPFNAPSCVPTLLIDAQMTDRARWEMVVRAIDVAVAITIILLLVPALALIALLIAAADGGTPFFCQQRLGQHGRTFACWKFRTMVPDADGRLARLLTTATAASADWLEHQKLARDPRITRIGLLLRRSSFDELPQLANVLLGHMSLVGSRPIVAAEVARYGRHFADYCRQRPGLSGLWQVSGRSTTSYRRRLACDRLFARRRSLSFYVRILIATIPAVLLARGAC